MLLRLRQFIVLVLEWIIRKIDRRKSREIKTPSGLALIPNRREDVPIASNICKITEIGGHTCRYACNHEGPWWFVVSIYGVLSKQIMDDHRLCPECYLEDIKWKVIRCASCCAPIFPGSPVGLYSIESDRKLYLDSAKRAGKGSVIGCMRFACAGTNAIFAGHWDGKRLVPAYDNLRTAADEALKTGMPIVFPYDYQ